jgi:hypothetical protein
MVRPCEFGKNKTIRRLAVAGSINKNDFEREEKIWVEESERESWELRERC